ncbi:hypothetical protein K469DRAFT_742919 [Zopfia rhizophila CBS 207.26]|uniref:Uncharacterized protein n=1 Tax=Zopfia rhizophila CBS 207.26 TaxID=1314779 RepID=A0A6A6DBI1_9PEZI|nr:hypothetical protein K469DRAFT_742919 [Zopfia rhizophila CBS 207.26]
MHLDLAADSKKDNPNPRIRDLPIKFTIGNCRKKGKATKWTKVYGPRLAKVLARFQPFRRDQPLGSFVQRSDNNYVMFAQAKYVQKQYGFYSYIPIMWDQINDMPLVPEGVDDESNADDVVVFEKSNNIPDIFTNFTAEDDCNGSGEALEIGAPIDKSACLDSY